MRPVNEPYAAGNGSLSPVGVAVVGLGYWGPNLVRNLYESTAADLQLICDTRPDAIERVARRYPRVRSNSRCR